MFAFSFLINGIFFQLLILQIISCPWVATLTYSNASVEAAMVVNQARLQTCLWPLSHKWFCGMESACSGGGGSLRWSPLNMQMTGLCLHTIQSGDKHSSTLLYGRGVKLGKSGENSLFVFIWSTIRLKFADKIGLDIGECQWTCHCWHLSLHMGRLEGLIRSVWITDMQT